MKKYVISDYVLQNVFGNDVFLHNTDTNVAIQLTGTSKDIFEVISKNEKTTEQIAKSISAKYDVSYDSCFKDIESILEKFLEMGFVKVV